MRSQFLEGMSYAASTVNIVTTDGEGGRAGVTVSAMSPVSADSAKPSLLICIHHQSATCRAILRNRVFCVHMMREDQSFVAEVFAGRVVLESGDKFDQVTWSPAKTGAPRLADSLVVFDCILRAELLYGTHYVLIGEVEDIAIDHGGKPLLHASRAYARSTPLATE